MMKTKFESFFIGLTMAVGVTIVYSGFQASGFQASREIASFKTKAKPKPIKFSSLKETVKFIEKNQLDQIEYSGRLIVENVDFFEDQIHLERYFLLNGRERIQIHPLNRGDLHKLSGKQVSVTGWQGPAGELSVFISGRLSQANNHIDMAAVKVEKMLVILANYTDSLPLTPRPDGLELVDKSTLANFLNTKAFRTYFNDMFQGKVRNVVTHVENYTFQRKCADKPLGGHPGADGYVDSTDIAQILNDLNLDPYSFHNVSVISNCATGFAWGIASLSNINERYLTTSHLTIPADGFFYGTDENTIPYLPSFPKYSFLDGLLHERLHNYNMGHANGLDCGTSEIMFPCTFLVYGNPFDVMGRRRSAFHLNADLLRRNEARPQKQFVTITKPGTYTIDPLETKDLNGIIGVYIKIPEIENTPVFMLEHRTAMGMDKTLIDPESADITKGLLLYTAIEGAGGESAVYYGYDFRLIDPYPQQAEPLSFLDRVRTKAIVKGKPYFDPMTGVRITIVKTPPVLKAQHEVMANRMAASSQLFARKMTFKVDFDSNARICFKAKIRDAVEPFRFIVNGEDVYGPDEIPSLMAGETFNIQASTHAGDNILCPREDITSTISNAQKLNGWMIVKPDFIAKDRPWPPDDDDTDGEPLIVNNLLNREETFNLVNDMRVPAPAEPGIYEFPVEYKFNRTGEVFHSVLKLRVIPYSTDKSKSVKLQASDSVLSTIKRR